MTCTTGLLLIVDTVLAYRMLCLYEMDYRLLVANIVLFSFGAASTAVIIGFCLSGFRVVATPRYLTGCWVTAGSSIFMALIPALAFELWLFVLVLIKLYQHIKEVGGMSQKTVTRILLKDSINWFFIISALILWNALNLAVAPEGLRGIVLPFLRSFTIIGGCRLIIHMRKQMFRNYSTSETAVSTAIRFGEREPNDDDHQMSWTKTRIISFAQQIGLPPPATIMSSMWPEGEEGIYETGSSSGDNEVIFLRHLEHNQGRGAVFDMP
ncbi:hypothetical protein FRC05_003729 [Tulasnella sp. 425]|nr:hypothetical protein FRC05_003729 [Tulasnella sp. 425]